MESFSGFQYVWVFQRPLRARLSLGLVPLLLWGTGKEGRGSVCSQQGGKGCLHFKAPEAVRRQEGLLMTLGREASPPQGNGEASGMWKLWLCQMQDGNVGVALFLAASCRSLLELAGVNGYFLFPLCKQHWWGSDLFLFSHSHNSIDRKVPPAPWTQITHSQRVLGKEKRKPVTHPCLNFRAVRGGNWCWGCGTWLSVTSAGDFAMWRVQGAGQAVCKRNWSALWGPLVELLQLQDQGIMALHWSYSTSTPSCAQGVWRWQGLTHLRVAWGTLESSRLPWESSACFPLTSVSTKWLLHLL